ncbi:ATP-binding cassette domain-containing protein [Nocardia barduliensis]|uniref:ATP-binding cassette domain-containing protein n=1 Tax=Nocardia barduliensis TaxID=2736643 RepID=UPI00157413DD|nr:ATP-binding cassette domain-containing protein [Nocardia barduliensis]
MRARVGEQLSLVRHLRDARSVTLLLHVVLLLVIAALPAATALATEQVIAGGAAGSLTAPLALFGGILVVGQSAQRADEVVFLLLKAQINGAHRSRVAALVVAGESIEELEKPEVRDLVRAATADPRDWIEKTPGDGALALLDTVIRCLGLAFALAVVARWSIWLVLPLGAAVLAVRAITARHWRGHYRIWSGNLVDSRRYLYWGGLTISAAEAKEARIFGFGPWLIEQHQHFMHRHLDPVWADDRRAAQAWLLRIILTVLPLALVYGIVANGVDAHSVAAAAAVFTAAWSAFTVLGRNEPVIGIQGAKPVVRATQELTHRLAGRPVPGGGGADALELPHIRFEGVGFRYPGADTAVLDGFHLELLPGEKIALVGLNGAGKSTVTKLLTGLYRPDSGRITADGVDIADIAGWQRQLAVVFQDFLRYPFSLAENIAMGRPAVQPDMAKIRAAAQDAGLTDVIARLPQGLETLIDPTRAGGVDLSGGQWQQVALARALYAARAGAGIVVLDEPTAHLDVRSERDLFDRLRGSTRDLSSILITHRLWTVRQVDRIVLLADGRVAESGSHDELMRAGGRYAEMYGLQAERFRRGFDDRAEEIEVVR